jgi:hypothetical protein
MNIASNFIPSGIVFLLTLVFGVWLSLAGKPYNEILFNIHKLIALGGVILAAWQIAQMLKGGGYPAALPVLLAAAALCVIALFASGALMSAGKLDYTVMLTVHRIALIAVVLAMAMIIYLLERKP